MSARKNSRLRHAEAASDAIARAIAAQRKGDMIMQDVIKYVVEEPA